MVSLKVSRAPNEELALSNCLLIHPDLFKEDVCFVLVESQYLFTIKKEESIQKDSVGVSSIHRSWAMISLCQEVSVVPVEQKPEKLNSVVISLDFQKKSTETLIRFETEEIKNVFRNLFMGQILSLTQPFAFDFLGFMLIGRILETSGEDNNGVFVEDTELSFIPSSSSKIKLKQSTNTQPRLFVKQDFKLEDLHIGGLDKEFGQIFQRAFTFRTFQPDVIEKFGVDNLRGIMLYGPPGTGKTLIARQFGKMLNSHEPKVVNGPEILNKYVGQSEENIRNLFKEAEIEQAERGNESQLHIIIFDEIDAICKKRGMRSDSTGTSDTVVNQLLSKMDGVNQLTNILVIGMTNRIDMIDEALLRPGRFDLCVEIGLPNETGRLQILKIHTAKMRENNILDNDVDLEEIAALTKNFTGAEIHGLVGAASTYALSYHVKPGTLATPVKDFSEIKVKRDDFIQAFETIKPALGVSGDDLKRHVPNGIIKYNASVQKSLRDGSIFAEQVKNSEMTPLVSILVSGKPGTGKTALSCQIALNSNFPFIRIISPELMVGFSEHEKVSFIHKVFNDAYKSPLGMIIIDDIESVFEFVPVGPRFSNSILQTLSVLVKTPPPKGRRLLILATTKIPFVLRKLGCQTSFNTEIIIPPITDLQSLISVLHSVNRFSKEEIQTITQRLEGKELEIGIKNLLMAIEAAHQESENCIDPFVSLVCFKEQELETNLFSY